MTVTLLVKRIITIHLLYNSKNELKLKLFSCVHQAGEALGAIGSADVLNILREYANDPQIEVHLPTCTVLCLVQMATAYNKLDPPTPVLT